MAIFAIDFDGTIVENGKYPNIGHILPYAIEVIKELQDNGHRIIIWTCREGRYQNEARWFLQEHGIIPDAINDNLLYVKQEFGHDKRKVLADYYLDDRSWPPFLGWERFREFAIEQGLLKE